MTASSRLTDEALRALARARTPEAIETAFELLPYGDARVRLGLLDRYSQLAAEGRRRDPRSLLRAALLRGLEGRALPEEIPLLEAALRTYEFIAGQEVAGRLRAAALAVLAGLEARLAAFHAVRLLADRHLSETPGEPAGAAARLLGEGGQAAVLYMALLAPDVQPEVAAACLANLGGVPPSILAALAQECWNQLSPAGLLALVDLLLAHPEAAAMAGPLAAIIEGSDDLDLVRYAAAAAVAGRSLPLIEALRSRADLPGTRGELVREALALAPP